LLGYVLTRMINKKEKPVRKYIAMGIAALFIIGFSIRSIVRVPVWKDALSLNRAAVKVSKNSARANCFMGTALFNKYLVSDNDDDKKAYLNEANTYITKSVGLYPKYLNGNIMSAGIAAEAYKFHRNIPQLLEEFEKVIRRRPDTGYIHEYCTYLNGRGSNVTDLTQFYLKIGRDVLANELNNHKFAAKFLGYGHELDPNNRAINQALYLSYTALNNNELALKHQQLANSVQ